MRKRLAVCICFLASLAPVSAQMTPEQREFDFRYLASLFAKNYAPYGWKRQLLQYDLRDIGSWLGRVRQAKDDAEFLEICTAYVAALKDSHSFYGKYSTFEADLGFQVDIYDGKFLIDTIDRQQLPLARFPAVVGDELVSIDGRPGEEIVQEFGRIYAESNAVATRRQLAEFLTVRPQYVFPRAYELPETARVAIRRQTGANETYELPWVKSSVPFRSIGPIPSPRTSSKQRARFAEGVQPAVTVPEYLAPLRRMKHLKAPEARMVRGWGATAPVFSLPSTFRQRLGRSADDFHFSGIYTAGGKRIGFLRIPSFDADSIFTLFELEDEIIFLQQNTDALVVDVTRNPGGGCYVEDALSYFIPRTVISVGEEIRPSRELVVAYEEGLQLAKDSRAEKWVLDLYGTLVDQIKQAYSENGGHTGPLPLCGLRFELDPARDIRNNLLAYTKPMLVLTDEFTTSAAEIFASVLQDNGRARIFGSRTIGAGGNGSEQVLAGPFSESYAVLTVSQIWRMKPIATPDYPTTQYIENVGIRPDISVEYMTKDNLLNRGADYVDQFTNAILEMLQ